MHPLHTSPRDMSISFSCLKYHIYYDFAPLAAKPLPIYAAADGLMQANENSFTFTKELIYTHTSYMFQSNFSVH